jgi:hypothetical protein
VVVGVLGSADVLGDAVAPPPQAAAIRASTAIMTRVRPE